MVKLKATIISRKYYKYVWNDAVSPIFTSKSDAENGIDGVRMLTGSDAYAITGTGQATMSRNVSVTFDLGENARGISSVGFIGWFLVNTFPSIRMKDVQCSIDGIVWDTITDYFGGRGDYLNSPLSIPTPNIYRYIRFTSDTDDGGAYGSGGIYQFTVNYQKRTPIPASEDDCDIYEDKLKYKALSSFDGKLCAMKG